MRWRVRARDENGQVAVEAALVLPIVLFVLFAVVDFGITLSHWLTLTDAVRAGARQGAVCHASTTSIESVVRQAAADLDQSKLSVSAGGCPPTGSAITVSATYPYSINVMGFVVKSGNLTSQTTERVE
jgi:Flp pilus assembly protein TadG